MNSKARLRAIEYQLIKRLNPEKLTVNDESANHVGHVGARSGAGYFSINIISKNFLDKSLIERHRMVYEAVSELLQTDIHAMKIHAKTPDEENPD